MINIQSTQILSQLDALDLKALARECGVDTGYTKKICGQDLLYGFLLLYNQQGASLEEWASCIESFSGQPVSKQAVCQRCTAKHARFFRRAAQSALRDRFSEDLKEVGPALRPFGRAFVEDSTCASLDRSLAKAFPSSYTKGAPAATARLQLRLDLKQERLTGFQIGSYRDNDQSYSQSVLEEIEPGDLVIRDLGYFSLSSLKAIGNRGGFFLSRLRFGVSTFDPDTGERIDLSGNGGLLERAERAGLKRIDQAVKLGVDRSVQARLICRRVPEEVAERRRRKAKNDRHTKANHNDAYLRHLGWNVFVTNVGPQVWEVETALEVYRLRWRIEIVFKALKSCFQAPGQLRKRRMPPARAKMTICGWLLYSALIVGPTYRYFVRQIRRRGRTGSHRRISLLRYCKWLRLRYTEVLQAQTLRAFLGSVARHCVYDRRRDRDHYHEKRRSVGRERRSEIANSGPQ